MYDLLIKNGKVIDPANKIDDRRDIGINNGKIAAIATSIESSEAKKVISARNRIVTPGLIDIHTHLVGGLKAGGVDPDKGGVLSGVTTLGDGGSVGYANFPGLRKFVLSQSQTDVFCFLHMCNFGIAVMPELCIWRNISREGILGTVAKNRDIIKGLKLRVIEEVVTNLGIEAIKFTKAVAVEAGLPIMIHIGLEAKDAVPSDRMDGFTQEMLSLLDKGDIMSHVFTGRTGSVIKDNGNVLSELWKAKQRGVVLDVAVGRGNWSSEIAKRGLGQGILPDTISTDLSSNSANGPVFSLPVTMSKFLALGLSLNQAVEMTTINPALALGEEKRRGSLGVGMPADISIFELTEGNFVFADGVPGKTFRGNLLLVPQLTLKAGREIQTEPRFENAH